MNEDWKPVRGVSGYHVSSFGRVIGPQGLLNPSLDEDGYEYVKASGRHGRVHRLVCEAFLPNPNGLPHVNHKDANKRNNRVDNLEWVTPAQNIKHSWEHGLQRPAFGEKHHYAKLCEADIKQIRALAKSGFRQWKIAEIYGVTQTAISAICTRRSWKHVEDAA